MNIDSLRNRINNKSRMISFCFILAGCASNENMHVQNEPQNAATCYPQDVQIISSIPPEYPTKEFNSGIESQVIAKITLDERGIITNIEITKSGGASFDKEVIRSLKNSKFTPLYVDCKPVSSSLSKTFNFKIPPNMTSSAN